ncbi:hypothetical protein ACEPAF_8038 [Sanghuangporus sanghuang]
MVDDEGSLRLSSLQLLEPVSNKEKDERKENQIANVILTYSHSHRHPPLRPRRRSTSAFIVAFILAGEMKYPISLLLVCLSVALVRVGAQTQTLVDDAGETVVVAVTTNLLGIATTQTLQTLDAEDETETDTSTSTTSTRTSTSTSTTTTQNQGPVGQPATTTETSVTTYQYTTTDAAGNTQVLQDVYTPTSHVTTVSALTFAGTIVDYSSWVGLIGTNTAATDLDAVSSAHQPLRLLQQKQFWAGAVAVAAGTLWGAWLVLL